MEEGRKKDARRKPYTSCPGPTGHLLIPGLTRDLLVIKNKSITFAMESSQGIRGEGMTTLSR